MQLTFHGTLSSIANGNTRHARQSLLEIAYGGRRLLIDCGRDWLGGLPIIDPVALLLTHAHDDHSGGLACGAPCPVYAAASTWEKIADFPLHQKVCVPLQQPFYIAGIRIEAFALQHSPRAPAVGYRIQAGRSVVFYCPDVARIPSQRQALQGVQLYIGDGAAYRQSLLRVEDGRLCGHAPLSAQLQWCAEAKIPRMLATHCGAEIIANENQITRQLQTRAHRLGIQAGIAHDGMLLKLP
ncbi:metal-dependent hydrolase, beta-lactamase superfamily [Syntrophotalea carbinolica DSM 2380]|uniref:Metal-dependent hydrolase, beta-lactamase superfamily n=1 Tax=Syntrophotalea carbinolica (strain DSM 2380 / NBRC 103641 / GraBd1) TaxID=338963 RepID=Q3A104_SYNC1|nr:MBL fold metallo-hydrolase [Syntrophotalea carbinolica]ABA89953.1 metal-dependent hydrolase, beta-lactamase superfamily [Syntrophotalea carbinolica DSM 2380]